MVIFLVFLCLFWGILVIFASFSDCLKTTLHNFAFLPAFSDHIDKYQYDTSQLTIDHADIIALYCYDIMIPRHYNMMYIESVIPTSIYNQSPVQTISTSSRISIAQTV